MLEYLDELDPLCQKMGSSNTVVKTPEGKLIGYNTDGVGFYTALTEEAGVKVDQCVFFCFGGGGAGRAMCSIPCLPRARKIYITDKFEGCAKSLVDDINKNFAPVAEFVPYGDFSKLSACDVVLTPAALAWGVPSGKRRSPRNT